MTTTGTTPHARTPTAGLDRNWNDLLQELRVAQTGVQLFTGLLLTVPFQARFADLTPLQRALYLVILGLSVLATGLLLSPVVLHRVLFRQHARRILVSVGQRCALAGLGALGLTVVGVTALIFDVVVSGRAGVAAGVVVFVVFAGLWGVGPILLRGRAIAEEEAAEEQAAEEEAAEEEAAEEQATADEDERSG